MRLNVVGSLNPTGRESAARPRLASVPGFAACAFAVCVAAIADADDVPRLAALLDGMQTYSAEFEQTVTNRFGDVLQTATGRMHLMRPLRLRWELDEPYPQLVVADGTALTVYDPDLEQATIEPLDEALAGSPAVFLTGSVSDIRRYFDVVATEPHEAEGHRFELTPVDPNAAFGALALSFAPDGALTGIDIADHLEQLTRVSLHERRLNPVLDSALFDFAVPPGTDVIGDLPGAPDG